MGTLPHIAALLAVELGHQLGPWREAGGTGELYWRAYCRHCHEIACVSATRWQPGRVFVGLALGTACHALRRTIAA